MDIHNCKGQFDRTLERIKESKDISEINKEIIFKFKDLIIDMHRGVPLYRYYGLIEQIIPDKEIRDYFFEKDVFVKSKLKTLHLGEQDKYFLGINGINLANTYIMQDLSNKTKGLTIWITILSIFLFILGIIQILLLIYK